MVSILTTDDETTLRLGYERVKRYLSIVPSSNVVFAGRVNDVSKDADYAGIYSVSFIITTSGDWADIKDGHTMYIGTSEGAKDIGIIRVRGQATSDTIPVDWTSDALVPIAYSHYLTVVDEFRPWPKFIRRVDTSDGESLSFDEYHNYDETYSDQNDAFNPICNVFDASTAWPFGGPKYAGFVDDGQTYRTVKLNAALSQHLGSSSTVSVYDWDIVDGAAFSGGIDQSFVYVRFPVGFRWISLTITDNNGKTSTHRIPIWVHDDTYLPTTEFEVTEDSTETYRSMKLKLHGFDSSYSESLLPKGTCVCYWEIATFGLEELSPPAQYRDRFLAWLIEDSTQLRSNEGDYEVSLADIGGWLASWKGFGQLLIDPGIGADTKWYHVPQLTHGKAAFWLLNSCAYVLPLMNFFPTTLTRSMKELELQEGSMWEQVTSIYMRIYDTPAFDTFGTLWSQQYFTYKTQADQDLTSRIMLINESDWADSSPPVIKYRHSDKVSTLDAVGSVFNTSLDPDTITVRSSKAPSRVFGRGLSSETAPYQDLPDDDSQAELNRLTGSHFSRINSFLGEVSVKLIHNLDIMEPAWCEPLAMSYSSGDLRDIILDDQFFIIRSISTDHSNDPKEPPKRITLRLEPTTNGAYAGTVPVISQPVPDTNPIVSPIPDRVPSYSGVDVLPTRLIIADSGGAHCHVAHSWIPSLSIIIYTDVSTGLTGYNIWLTADPWDYDSYYALQSTGLYHNPAPFSGGTWSLVANNLTLFGDSSYIGKDVQGSINRLGYFAILSHAVYVYTTDYGLTWHRISIIPGGDLSDPGYWQTDLSEPSWSFQLSPYNNPGAADQGWVYVAVATTTNNYKSEDWGATWVLLPAWTNDFINGVEIPYIRSDGVTPNINDAQQEWYSGRSWGGGGNQTVWMLSKTAGLTSQNQLNVSHSGVQMKTSLVHAGHSPFQTFTWDGRRVSMAGNWGGSFSGGTSNDALTSEVTPSSLDSPDGDYSHVNRFPTHAQASLWWNSQSIFIWWTTDDSATMQSAAAPAGYIGVGNVQWKIDL